MIPSARRELKYLVPETVAERLRDAIDGVCRLDEHCRGRARHRYVIDSLYLDGPGLPFYRAKVDRAQRRLKLRVRSYDEAFGHGYLEVKRKIGDVVHKTRSDFLGDWRNALAQPASPAAHDFAAVRDLTGAEPTAWVRYEREAWASELESYARVTFDYRVQFQPAVADDAQPAEGAWAAIDDAFTEKTARSCVIVELKYEDVAPAWMARLVTRFDLFRRGYSKYCAGVDQLWGRYRPLEPMGREPVLG